MNRLSAQERRLVAIGLLVLAITALWFAVVLPIADGFSAREAQRRTLVETYQRNQRLLDAIPAWRAEAEAQRVSAGAFALTAPSQVEAQEMLKQRLSAAISQDGSAPPQVQDVQTELPAGWIGARADAQLTLPQLDASLRKLESEEPYVVVEYLSINADEAFRTGHAGPLGVQLEISAPYRLAGPQ
jgi:general secretion pathway protein M